MKIFALILVSLLLSCSLAAITDFWDNEYIDHNTLLCLQQNQYLDEVFTLATLNTDTNQWKTNVQLQEIQAVGTTPQVIISTSNLQGRLPPQLEAHRIHRQFEDSPVLRFWINISSFPGSFRPSCDYLKKLARYLELYTKTSVGIQTEPMFWQDLFGDRMACPELGRYELFLSFNNFRAFGGWRSFSYYETYQSVDACGYPGMQVFKK